MLKGPRGPALGSEGRGKSRHRVEPGKSPDEALSVRCGGRDARLFGVSQTWRGVAGWGRLLLGKAFSYGSAMAREAGPEAPGRYVAGVRGTGRGVRRPKILDRKDHAASPAAFSLHISIPADRHAP